jgi:hypothetical protein
VYVPPTATVTPAAFSNLLSSNPAAMFTPAFLIQTGDAVQASGLSTGVAYLTLPSPPPLAASSSMMPPSDPDPDPASSSLPMIAGGAGGGALLLAAVAFFMYRRRSKRQSDGELPQFSSSKPQQAAAPVFTPAPLFLTPAVRSRPNTHSRLNAGSENRIARCVRRA